MIEEITYPRWFRNCKHRLTIEDKDEKHIIVKSCRDAYECYGCDPKGTILPKSLLKLKEIRSISSMAVPEEELDCFFFTENTIKRLTKEYADSSEQFYYSRDIVCDLDTITIWRVIS